MKFLLTTIVLFILIWGMKRIYAYSAAQNSCFKNIKNQAFKEKMQADNQVVILDVRSLQEFRSGHIEGAKNIDIQQPNFKSQIQQLDKNKTYLVYCRSGVRSLKAASILCKEGFSKVYNLQHGYMGWS